MENVVDRVLKEMPDSFGIKTFLVTNREEVRIQGICDVAANFAPDYDIDRVLGAVFAKKRAEV